MGCHVFEPITYSTAGDTPATVRQIVGHNAALVSLCPEKAP